MERHEPSHESRQPANEKQFVYEVFRGAADKLAAYRGDESFSTPVDRPLYEYMPYEDPDTHLKHVYSFVATYDPAMKGFEYVLSHSEKTAPIPFLTVDPYVQTQILRQLEDMSARGERSLDTLKYIRSIEYLRALQAGAPLPTGPSGFYSLVFYSQRVETQYKSNDRDHVISKTIITQQLLDDQVLTETIDGDENPAGLDSQESYDAEGALFNSLEATLAYSDIEQDIPEMQAWLKKLNLLAEK